MGFGKGGYKDYLAINNYNNLLEQFGFVYNRVLPL